jgi:putative transposase
MKQAMTISCKLNVSSKQSEKLDETMQVFAKACNHTNEVTPPTLANQIAMQALIYNDVRALFGLSANLTIQAIRRVCANRKSARQKGKKVKSFEPSSVSYDARIFAFREKDWTVSLTTIDGRERFSLNIGNYQRGLLKGAIPTSATLIKRQDGDYYIQIQLKSEPPIPGKPSNVIGVDFGRRDIAYTSTGDNYSGQAINKVRDHYAKLRQSIQQKATKGTRSTRRRARTLLKRLSSKERRFQSLVNHTISRRIVKQAVQTNSVIAIEDLTGIRERTNQQPRNKTERRRSNSWAFYQLRTFLEYKALRYGAKIVVIPPQYTSKTCHKCLHIGIRTDKKFACTNCGYKGDSDYNGANVIRLLGLHLDQPEGSDYLCCSLSVDNSGLLKSPCSA